MCIQKMPNNSVQACCLTVSINRSAVGGHGAEKSRRSPKMLEILSKLYKYLYIKNMPEAFENRNTDSKQKEAQRYT